MSGHSKWSSIKHQKGVTDARRGQLFTKLTREIIVAVRQAGSNPESNFRLRLSIQKARDNNMPLDNIEKAIKRGSGTIEGANLVEMVLEGYGPGGTAILVEALTDNRNRTLQDIRNIFYDMPVVLCTAYDTFKEDMKSIAADFYVIKSFDLTELKSKIAMALEAGPNTP